MNKVGLSTLIVSLVVSFLFLACAAKQEVDVHSGFSNQVDVHALYEKTCPSIPFAPGAKPLPTGLYSDSTNAATNAVVPVTCAGIVKRADLCPGVTAASQSDQAVFSAHNPSSGAYWCRPCTNNNLRCRSAFREIQADVYSLALFLVNLPQQTFLNLLYWSSTPVAPGASFIPSVHTGPLPSVDATKDLDEVIANFEGVPSDPSRVSEATARARFLASLSVTQKADLTRQSGTSAVEISVEQAGWLKTDALRTEFGYYEDSGKLFVAFRYTVAHAQVVFSYLKELQGVRFQNMRPEAIVEYAVYKTKQQLNDVGLHASLSVEDLRNRLVDMIDLLEKASVKIVVYKNDHAYWNEDFTQAVRNNIRSSISQVENALQGNLTEQQQALLNQSKARLEDMLAHAEAIDSAVRPPTTVSCSAELAQPLNPFFDTGKVYYIATSDLFTSFNRYEYRDAPTTDMFVGEAMGADAFAGCLDLTNLFF